MESSESRWVAGQCLWGSTGTIQDHSNCGKGLPGKGKEGIRSPIGGSAAGAFGTGTEDNVSRQIFGFASQTIRDPCAHAGPAKLLGSGVHENLPWRVIKRVRVHGFDNGDIIHDFRQVRKQFGKLGAGLAMPVELEFRSQQGGTRIDKRRAVTFDQFGWGRFAVPFGQFRFVIKQFEVTGRTGHEKEDDPFGFGCKMGRFRRQGIVESRGDAQPFSRKSVPNAMAPRPTPHCSKNQRRVMSFLSVPR